MLAGSCQRGCQAGPGWATKAQFYTSRSQGSTRSCYLHDVRTTHAAANQCNNYGAGKNGLLRLQQSQNTGRAQLNLQPAYTCPLAQRDSINGTDQSNRLGPLVRLYVHMYHRHLLLLHSRKLTLMLPSHDLGTAVRLCSQRPRLHITLSVYTTIKTTRLSVTEVGALSAAGWAWSLHGKQTWIGNCK